MSDIRVDRVGSVGRIVLARGDRGNVLDRVTAEAIFEALQRLESDGHVRAVQIRGDGPDFSLGTDIEALDRLLAEPAEMQRADAEALGRVYLAARALMKPVICAVTGRALGSGAGLALACDVILARDDAEFGFAEVRMGFVPAILMTMLRRTVGEKRAADLVLSGRVIDAEEADRIGLVSRVLPAASYDADVEAMLTGLSRSSPTSLALTKWLLYKLDALSFEDGIAAGIVTDVEARATDDFKNAMRTRRGGADPLAGGGPAADST